MMNTNLLSLPQWGMLAVHGTDAEDFLQGQLSCDIKALHAENSLLGAYCDHKGRMLAICRLFRLPQDGIALVMPRPLLAATQQRLRLFTLRRQVSIRDVSDSYPAYGAVGEPAITALSLPQIPAHGHLLHHQQGIFLRWPGAAIRLLCYGLSSPAAEPPSLCWQQLDIAAGLPSIYPETAGQFVPQMLHLERWQGVHFDKGCYTGQEVIARLHYRGSSKRGLYHLRIAATHCPAPGKAINRDNGLAAGAIIDAATHAPQHHMALACLRHPEDGETLFLADDAAAQISLQPLAEPTL